MKRLLLLLALVGQVAAAPRPGLGAARHFYIDESIDPAGASRAVRACLPEKLAAVGPFTVVNSTDKADARIIVTASVPGAGVACGLANGLAKKIASAVNKASRTNK